MRRTDNGRWEARYRSEAGKELARRFATKREADAYLSRMDTAMQRGDWVDPTGGRVRLDDLVERWREVEVRLRPSSRARDDSYLRTHVLPTFGQMPIGKISNLDVRMWVAGLNQQGLAPATVQKAHQTLSKVLRFGVDTGLLLRNPCDRVPLPRIERKEMRVLDPAQIEHLASVITPRYSALVTFGAYSGLRIGELAGLRRDRLDLARREVRVNEIAVEVRGDVFRGPPRPGPGTARSRSRRS